MPSPSRRCWPTRCAPAMDLARAIGGGIIVIGLVLAHPAFDARPLSWIGFVTAKPATEDYVPLAPWAGFVFLGIAVGHVARRPRVSRHRAPRPRAAVVALARAPQPGGLHGPPADFPRRALARRRMHGTTSRDGPTRACSWMLVRGRRAELRDDADAALHRRGRHLHHHRDRDEAARGVSSSIPCTAPTTVSRRFSTGSSFRSPMPLAGNMCSSPRGWSPRAPPSRPGSCWPGSSQRSPRTGASPPSRRSSISRAMRCSITAGLRTPIRCSRSSTFAAIACLWVATARRSIALVWVAAAAISCAALTKGQSAYPFYAVTALVLLCRRDLRGFLLRPGVIVPHARRGRVVLRSGIAI